MATQNEGGPRQTQQQPPPGHHQHSLTFQAPLQPMPQPQLEPPHAALQHYQPTINANFAPTDAMQPLHNMPMELWEQPSQSPPLQAMEWDRAAAEQDASLGGLPQDLMHFSGLAYPQPDPHGEFMASMAERSPYPLVSHSQDLELEPINYVNYTPWHGLEPTPTGPRPAVSSDLPSTYPVSTYQSAFPSAFPAAHPPAAASAPGDLVAYSVPATTAPLNSYPSSLHPFQSSTPSFAPSQSIVPSSDPQHSPLQGPYWQMTHTPPPAAAQGANGHSQGARTSRPAMVPHPSQNVLPAPRQIGSQPQYIASNVQQVVRQGARVHGDFAAVGEGVVNLAGRSK
jgi:hypothetical protein